MSDFLSELFYPSILYSTCKETFNLKFFFNCFLYVLSENNITRFG